MGDLKENVCEFGFCFSLSCCNSFCTTRTSIRSLIAATLSMDITFSNLYLVCCHMSLQPMFNSSTMNFRSSCNSLKNFHSFCLGGDGGGGGKGCNRLKLHFLSLTVRAAASTTISLCTRNSSPRIIGAHKPKAIITRTDFEDQKEEGSCTFILMYLEKSMLTFCPSFSIVSSAV